MKQLLSTLTLLLLTLNIYSQTKETEVAIDGIIKNLKPGDSVLQIDLFELNLDSKKENKIDSIPQRGSSLFSFGKRLLHPGYYRIGYKGKLTSASALLLLDKGSYHAKILIDTFIARVEGAEPFIMSRVYVEGIKDNEMLDSFFSVRRHYYLTLEAPLKKRLTELETIEGKELEKDSLNTELKRLKTENENLVKKIVLEYMGTSLAIYQTMGDWNNSDYDFIDQVVEKFKKLKPNSFITPIIEQKAQLLKNTSLVKKKAIEFSLPNHAAQEISLTSFLKKEIILLDFWASWCGPCLKEMPSLKRIYEKYKTKGFTVIGISTDTDGNAWKNAISKQQLPWTNLIDKKELKSNVSKKYGIYYLPTNFLIDKDGTIIKKNISHYELEKYLAENTQK